MNAAARSISEAEDHFEVFNLPRRFRVDPKGLMNEFLALSREHHPDRFADASAEEQAAVQRSSARVNDAYRTLKDPVLRAEYLLSLSGVEREPGAAKCPPDLLMEVFELREQLAESPTGELGEKVRGMLSDVDARLASYYERHDLSDSPEEKKELLALIRKSLDRRKFLVSLDREVEQALGS